MNRHITRCGEYLAARGDKANRRNKGRSHDGHRANRTCNVRLDIPLGDGSIHGYGRECDRFGIGSSARMFVRLTKSKRLRAGWCLALVYLLCVLAPGISFAFSDGSRVAPCLIDDDHSLGIVHMHQLGERASQHVHMDFHGQFASHSQLGQLGNFDDVTSASNEASSPAPQQHKTSGVGCCGMVCVSALPATVAEIVKPVALISVCKGENYRNIAGSAPLSHYRPPIS